MQTNRALLLLALMGMWGCPRPQGTGVFDGTRTFVADADDFGLLLLKAGLDPDVIPSGDELTVEQARHLRMLLRFGLADGHMVSYGPRITAGLLLAEALQSGEDIPRRKLNERLRRFRGLAVLRPDGYLAGALSGAPLQCVGPVRMQEGTPQAGDFKLGSFYALEGNSFREDPGLLTHESILSGVEVSTEK